MLLKLVLNTTSRAHDFHLNICTKGCNPSLFKCAALGKHVKMKMQNTGEKMKKSIQSTRLISHEQAATSEGYGST